MRRAWIIGAGSGIGEALALALSKQGVKLTVSGRSQDKLAAVASRCLNQCDVVPFDITDADSCHAAWRQVELSGVPDLVVISSGDHIETPVNQLSTDTCDHLMSVNYLGVVRVIELILPAFKKQGGQIAVVASLAGYRGLPRASGYGASKAALINFCESLKLELLSSNVDLRLINPGFVKTPLTDKNQFKMPQLISPEEAAKEIIRGLSGRQFEIRFPKGFARIMGLLRHLPYSIYLPLVKRMTRT